MAAITTHQGDCLDVIPRLVALGTICDSIVTDPPFRPETWATLITILRPGGYLVAFGGTRTYHRMTCAIEDAGFVIQDCIMWLYGSENKTVLKPSYEPIVLAYKPGGKRTMQVEECRIGTDAIRIHGYKGDSFSQSYKAKGTQPELDGYREGTGRWPANVCHDGSDEVVSAFPESAGQQGDVRGTEPSVCFSGVRGGPNGRHVFDARKDSGSAARFFYSSEASKGDDSTTKSVNLIRWLVRLVTPLNGIVLDPFAASGSTGEAVFAEQRNAILIDTV